MEMALPFQKLDFLRAIWPGGNREKAMGRGDPWQGSRSDSFFARFEKADF
jgi:hypothetical protein